MHRIDTKTAQKDKFGAGKNGFTRGNPQTGTPATDLDDDYFDMLQEELCGVVEASGASLEKGRNDQLLTALRALLLSRKNPFGDIKSDGTVKTALENLGLGETINKASGAMQKSANGADISDVSAFRNALQLGTAATRDVGADNASKLLDLDSFRSMMSGNGYIYIPCIATTGNPVKLMLQWGTVATQKGADAGYALPFAFPYAGLFATGNRGTSGYNAAMNVRIASRTHISIQNWSPSGEGTEDCCFIALGY
ncbi:MULTISPECIES: gp53-like domain-containing protein [Escherichia]|uniref:gp53-like domain-containing protein n=1 Tax=Escherichia TaxID=561 RepID=UPI0013625364